MDSGQINLMKNTDIVIIVIEIGVGITGNMIEIEIMTGIMIDIKIKNIQDIMMKNLRNIDPLKNTHNIINQKIRGLSKNLKSPQINHKDMKGIRNRKDIIGTTHKVHHNKLLIKKLINIIQSTSLNPIQEKVQKVGQKSHNKMIKILILKDKGERNKNIGVIH